MTGAIHREYRLTGLASTLLLALLLALGGCAPEVGSKGWCENMQDKPKGDWTANEALEYAENCLLD